jgi:hypothetical protein
MRKTSTASVKNQTTLLDEARRQSQAEFWKPVKPDTGIEGQVISITEGGKYNSVFYHVQQDNSEVLIVPGGDTVLGKKLSGLHVEIGDRIGVLYLGEGVSKSGQKYKSWSVVSNRVQKPKAGGNGGNNPPLDDIPS